MHCSYCSFMSRASKNSTFGIQQDAFQDLMNISWTIKSQNILYSSVWYWRYSIGIRFGILIISNAKIKCVHLLYSNRLFIKEMLCLSIIQKKVRSGFLMSKNWFSLGKMLTKVSPGNIPNICNSSIIISFLAFCIDFLLLLLEFVHRLLCYLSFYILCLCCFFYFDNESKYR